MNLNALQKEALQRRLAQLVEQWQALERQLDGVLDYADAVKLRLKVEALWGEIEKVNAELEADHLKSEDPGARYRSASANFPRIDYRRVVPIVQGLARSRYEGRLGLLLLQESPLVGGKWCLERIRQLLKEEKEDFVLYEVEVLPGARAGALGVLDGLARHLDVSEQDDLVSYANSILDRLCSSLTTGSLVYLEFRRWNHVKPYDISLPWLVEHFWGGLAERLEARSWITVIAAIATDDAIPDTILSPLCGTWNRSYDGKRLINLPMQRKWSSREIHEWMGRHSGFEEPALSQIVESIYASTDQGRPTYVYHQIFEYLSRGV